MISVARLKRVIRLVDTDKIRGITGVLAAIIKEEGKNGRQELR